MGLKLFVYTDEKNKKYKIKVRPVSVFSMGLMFRKKSLPLLFDVGKSREFGIHSFFCKPFKAIWLDDKRRILKVIDGKGWRLNLRGEGRYLLEIPVE